MHYSAAELENLIAATNRVCGENSRKSLARHFTPFNAKPLLGQSLKDFSGHFCLDKW